MHTMHSERHTLTLKDSGTRSEFTTGAVRDAEQGKGRFDLLPYEGIEAVARVMEAGSLKYGERNWEKGIPLHRYVDSAMRHLHKFAAGHRDEPHLAQAAWNCLCCLETMARIQQGLLPKELNTLPNNPLPPVSPRVAAHGVASWSPLDNLLATFDAPECPDAAHAATSA